MPQETNTNLVTYMDVRAALDANDGTAISASLCRALLDERQQSALEAIKDFTVQQNTTENITDESFDAVAIFLVSEKLFGSLYKLRRNIRRCTVDRRFVDFYKFCIHEMRKSAKIPSLSVVDTRATAVSISMRLRSGGDATEQELDLALREKSPEFVRDWIYRVAAGLKQEYLPTVIKNVRTLNDLESLLHEMSISGPLHGRIHTISASLSSKIDWILSNSKFLAREILEDGFGEPVDSQISFPKIINDSKLLRSDLEAFNSRFIFRTESGYLAYGYLGIGLGYYAIIYDGHRQVMFSIGGVTPNPAHIKNLLSLDKSAMEKLSKSESVLINPNFFRLGDCLDRFGFINDIIERSKISPADLSNIHLLQNVENNFTPPIWHTSSGCEISVLPISEIINNRFCRIYINSSYFRNNVDRRLSFSKPMVRSLSSKDRFDSQGMLIKNLRSHGYFIVHFAIEAEKREFRNQWEVLAQTVLTLRKSGIDKIVMLNSGLTSAFSKAKPTITEFETNWPEKIVNLLPSEYRKDGFIPVDLHMRSVDRKAKAIAMAHYFIGGLVTATLIPTSAGIPSLIVGSKSAILDKNRLPSGELTFFVPGASSTDVLSEKAKDVKPELHAQYMSYEINRGELHSRLTESLGVAIKRWRMIER